MGGKSLKKRGSAGKGSNSKKKTKSSMNHDPFFGGSESKRRRKNVDYYNDDDEILSSEEEREEEHEEDYGGGMAGDEEEEEEEGGEKGKKEEKEEEEEETAAEKRQRIAKEYLEKLRRIKRQEEEEEEDEDGEGADRKYEKEEERDSAIANNLMQKQLEDSGRVRKSIASRVQKPEDGFEVLVKHQRTVTAVCLSDDDSKGFSASKDGTILHWDADSGKSEKYRWPSEEVLKSHGAKDPQGRASKRSRNVVALAVSTDGRYLASAGLDRHVHLWDTRTREHIQAFPGHRGPVSCLSFRQGTSELFSGSYDRSIKIWNVEDRAYINTLFGHQSEVLTIDCLRKERVLAAGRDRTMQLFKVPEESRLIFRASASSLECCCFIDNDEFLSGSDDGNIELWSMQKKKPIYIVKNAHALLDNLKNLEQQDGQSILNGRLESHRSSSAYSWVSSVTVCRGGDLAASGAGNGFVRIWALDSLPKGVRFLYDLPLVGFVNSIAFAKSAKFLAAGVGQEPRLGRWGLISAAQNGVAVQRLKLS